MTYYIAKQFLWYFYGIFVIFRALKPLVTIYFHCIENNSMNIVLNIYISHWNESMI